MSHKGDAYSASGAIFLDNPIRRLFQPPSELIEKLGINPNDVAMDFGCGPGYFTIELAKRAKHVVAADVSPEMLKKVQKKAEKAKVQNIQFLQSDGKNIQLEDSSLDLILLVTVYHEVGDSEAVLKEFGRVLKLVGKLAIVEVIKSGIFAFAPKQNPEVITAEVEAANFRLQEMTPYKSYGVFLFTKES